MSADQPYTLEADLWPGLAKLTEEVGELHQVLGKLMATGGSAEHWDGGGDLVQRLQEELADARAAIGFFIMVNELDEDAIIVRDLAKVLQFRAWRQEQRQTGAPDYSQGEGRGGGACGVVFEDGPGFPFHCVAPSGHRGGHYRLATLSEL